MLRYTKGSTEKATLIDTDGELFDYTPVLSAHQGIAGANFKQTLIFYDPGIRFVDVSARNGIQNIHSLQGTRGMVEMSAQELYIFHSTRSSLFVDTDRTWNPASGTLSCMEGAFADSDLAKDKAGNIWFT